MQSSAMNQLQAMRVFVKVVELNSFGLAGKQLGISAAATSRSISILEAHLNMRLINRSTRSLTLTEAGREYLSGCQAVIGKLDEIEMNLVHASREPSGTLLIASSTAFALSTLAPILQAYRAQFPKVNFDVRLFDTPIDFIEGGFDVCFATEKRLPSSSLVSRALTTISEVAVASPDYLVRHGRPLSPADLANHDLLTTSDGGPRQWELHDTSGTYRVLPRGLLTTTSSEMVRQSVLAHMGIAVLPRPLVEPDLASGALETVLTGFTLSGEAREVAMVYSGRRYLSAKTRSFIDFVVAHFRRVEPTRWLRSVA